MKNRILILFLLITSTAVSQIHSVKQDGSGDFTTIQSAVDAAGNGDTVLVWPGTWFENVEITGKNISLGSLTLTTGDLGYIEQTIINGNFNGSCIRLKNCQDTNLVNGFSLTKGSGSYHGSIGGGGMSVYQAPANIFNCKIFENQVTGRGGAIYIEESWVFLSNTSIYGNHALKSGGGINIIRSELIFDSQYLCSIYLNYSSQGTDISKGGPEPLDVIVDTFTVKQPDYYYAFSTNGSPHPVNNINFSINSAKIEAVSENLYVSPQGDNNNTGLSASDPLKDIYFALLKLQSDSLNPDTIFISEGIYSPLSGEKFPLSIKGHIHLSGINEDSCILDGNAETFLLYSIINANRYSISNLVLQNGSDQSSPWGYGAILFVYNDHATLNNLTFRINSGKYSSNGAISESNKFRVINCTFQDNHGGEALRSGSQSKDSTMIINTRFLNNRPIDSLPETAFGGGMAVIGDYSSGSINCYFYNCLFAENHTKDYIWSGANSIAVSSGAIAYLINCTLGNNTSDNDLGANIGVVHNSYLYIYNSILYNNYPAEIYMFTVNSGDSKLEVYNSLVHGGSEEIRILTPDNVVYYDQSNIDTDPMWDTTSLYPYSLSYGSPCINTGTLDLPPEIELPETDLAGNPRVWDGQIDMGAYEYGPWVGVGYRPPVPPAPQISAAPNPFFHETTINFKVKEKGKQQIRVYDIHGNHISTLLDVTGLPGSGNIRWSTGDNGHQLPAGVYIIELLVNGKSKGSVKVVKK